MSKKLRREPSASSSGSKLVGHLAAAGAYSIFGLNIVFNKDLANAGVVDPSALFVLRAGGAAALFWIISFLVPREKVPLKDIGALFLASVIGLFIPQYAFLWSITMTTAIDCSILSTLSPIFTMCFAAVFLKEPITLKKAGGVAISFSGVVFLIFNSVVSGNGVTQTSPWGIVLLLLNSISFAAYLGVFRPLVSRYSVVTTMKWMFLFSLLLSLPVASRELLSTDFASIPFTNILEIAYIVFFATFVAYFLIPVGQKRIRPTLVSLYSYLQPIIAAIIAICTGLDTFTWQKIVATLFVVGGVIIVNRSRAAS